MLVSGLAIRWLKRGAKPAANGSAASAPDAKVSRLAEESRRELLAAISDFLIEHELAVCPENLAVAYTAVSGTSPSLARRVAARTAAGEPVTQKWLQEACGGPDTKGDEDASRQLSAELDRSLNLFARSTSAARSATSEYGVQLDRHVSQLSGEVAGEPVRDLAAMAQEMAERVRIAETELRASEREAKALRRRLNQARRDAERDHLTGLPNRRAFESELLRQYAEAREAGHLLSVAFCDVDHFKLINDQHGHDAGDRILKLIAQTFTAISDNNCHVARHGGEEFVLLFRGETVREAMDKLDAAREDLAARRLVNRDTDTPVGQVTFSAGVADAMAYAAPQDALRAADEALLRAKDQGRNRVIAAGVS
jgi:diguanylate cyclase